MKTIRGEELSLRYLAAKARLIQMGYSAEIDWQQEQCISDISESDFLREVAWVILSSGMKETVVRSKFKAVSNAFCNWKSAKCILRNERACLKKALTTINHIGKMCAILQVCKIIRVTGFSEVIRRTSDYGVEYIKTFPYMGPITSYHLAKNLGLDVVKPDRHLSRISKLLGFDSPSTLCRKIAKEVGDKLSVVDIVLWRYFTLFRYEELLVESFS